MAFDYSDAPYPIRSDLADAFRKAWDWIAAPGSFWTGAQRVAIVAEARLAKEDFLRRGGVLPLSPSAVERDYDVSGELPEAASEAIHRIVTDASRISKGWLDRTLAAGLSEGAYVELLGVVVMSISIDAFHRALGLAPEPLPAPVAGEPTGEVPAGLVPGPGYVATLDKAAAVGPYEDLFPPLPQIPNVLRALSQVPSNVRMLSTLSSAQYLPHERLGNLGANTGRALSRSQIELVAGRVSALNECFY